MRNIDTKSEASTFAERLKQLRKQKGVTQEELARRIGVTRRTICYYEYDAKRPPSLSLLKRIAAALGITMETLSGCDPIKTDNRTIDAKFWKKWEHLNQTEKKTVAQMVDTLLAAKSC